jgi:thiol-disulfide isomerase/thioredoxin
MMKKLSVLLFALLAACGGGGGDNGEDVPRGAYPAGPYGTSEGTILEALTFIQPDGTPRSFEDIWKDNTKKLLLVVTASGWCVACIDEQPELKSYHEKYAAKGLAILEAYFEDSEYQPATKEGAESWKRQYELPFDVVADPEFKTGAYYDPSSTPMNMMVDVNEMKILRISVGFDPNATEAIITGRLQ